MENLKRILKVNYPIVQAPMLGVTTPAMVAAVSNAGALGSLPVGGLSPERTRELIQATKALTSNPFAVNLFAHSPADEVNEEDVNRMQDFLKQLCTEYHIPFERQNIKDFRFYYYEDLIDILLEEDIQIVSFTFGQLKAAVITAFKAKGIVLIGTTTCIEEARILQQSGVDVITVQGIEAGGHRGTFLTNQSLPLVTLSALLPQIADEIKLPLLAAGGIYNGRTIEAAFALGASGVQVGSLFITADESAASQLYKETILKSTDTSTILTRAFSGRWARGIQNELMKRMDAEGITIPYYTIQNQLMSPIRSHALKHNLPDFLAMWAGQCAGQAVQASTTAIITNLIDQLK